MAEAEPLDGGGAVAHGLGALGHKPGKRAVMQLVPARIVVEILGQAQAAVPQLDRPEEDFKGRVSRIEMFSGDQKSLSV